MADVAARYGVSQATVRRWIGRGLRYVQPIQRGRVLIRQQDLDVFLQVQQRSDVTPLDRMIEEVLGSLQNKTAEERQLSCGHSERCVNDGKCT